MSITEYEFVDKWRVRSTCEEVSDILLDGADLQRWWPSIYLRSTRVRPNGRDGTGGIVDLVAQGGRLPYVLKWQAEVIQNRTPHGFTIRATGAFVGTGEWILQQDGPDVNVTFIWKIRVDAAVLRFLSPLIKPVLAGNHRWAMARGQESLTLELARRHVVTPNDLLRIPAPPGPRVDWPYTFAIGSGVLLATVAAGAGLLALLRLFFHG